MHGGRHREVLRLLEDPSLADPNGGHRAIVSGDIPAVFPCRDALITDVSSVARDSLHLRHGPLFVAAATTTGTGCTRAHR
ncbi:MAG: hypothetical protein WCG47_29365 [Dermatophilaceae bacterium]